MVFLLVVQDLYWDESFFRFYGPQYLISFNIGHIPPNLVIAYLQFTVSTLGLRMVVKGLIGNLFVR